MKDSHWYERASLHLSVVSNDKLGRLGLVCVFFLPLPCRQLGSSLTKLTAQVNLAHSGYRVCGLPLRTNGDSFVVVVAAADGTQAKSEPSPIKKLKK